MRRGGSRALQMLLIICLVGCRDEIMHNLSEAEANRLITRLHESGVEAQKEPQSDGQWALAVDDADAIKALKLLSDNRLIREDTTPIKSGSSVISSREDQRFRFERGLSGEIERTLGSMSGVLEARVHLNLPLVDPIFGQRMNGDEGSASVLLITDGAVSLDKAAISSLVAGASGIKPAQISVLVSAAVEPMVVDNSPPVTLPEAASPAFELPQTQQRALILSVLGTLLLVPCVWAVVRWRKSRLPRDVAMKLQQLATEV